MWHDAMRRQVSTCACHGTHRACTAMHAWLQVTQAQCLRCHTWARTPVMTVAVEQALSREPALAQALAVQQPPEQHLLAGM